MMFRMYINPCKPTISPPQRHRHPFPTVPESLGQFCPSNPRLGGFQHRPTHGSFQTWGVPQNPIQLGKHMIIHWNVGYTGIPWYTSFSNKSTLPNPTLSSMALKLSARNCKKHWKIISLHDDDRHHSYASTTCIINKYLASSICIYNIYIYAVYPFLSQLRVNIFPWTLHNLSCSHGVLVSPGFILVIAQTAHKLAFSATDLAIWDLTATGDLNRCWFTMIYLEKQGNEGNYC